MTDKDKNHEHDKDKHAAPPLAPAKEPLAGGSKGAGGPATALPPEAYMTEQEKAGLAEAGKAKKETK